jgi:hypothetical protein
VVTHRLIMMIPLQDTRRAALQSAVARDVRFSGSNSQITDEYVPGSKIGAQFRNNQQRGMLLLKKPQASQLTG